MIKQSIVAILALLALAAQTATAFAPVQPAVDVVTVAALHQQPQLMTVAPSQQLMNQGVQKFLEESTSPSPSVVSSSSVTLSLKDRVIPTAEEIAAKKRNFNLIFWGGGFVAPLLSTIFYFGFRFWEK